MVKFLVKLFSKSLQGIKGGGAPFCSALRAAKRARNALKSEARSKKGRASQKQRSDFLAAPLHKAPPGRQKSKREFCLFGGVFLRPACRAVCRGGRFFEACRFCGGFCARCLFACRAALCVGAAEGDALTGCEKYALMNGENELPRGETNMELTHLDENGAARMVDVGEKQMTRRMAQAQAVITMRPETLRKILDGDMPKGDVFACARIAGIMAAKRTSELIPMCHPIPIDGIEVELKPAGGEQVRIVSTLRCTYKTGIEMEALTAASVAALTVYDMCKAIDRSMRIDEVLLLHKEGGKSGTFDRTE